MDTRLPQVVPKSDCHSGHEQIFTSFNNPKGDAETERFMRTLKEKLLWLEEFDGPNEARQKMGACIDFYNNRYLRSSLGYRRLHDGLYFLWQSGQWRRPGITGERSPSPHNLRSHQVCYLSRSGF